MQYVVRDRDGNEYGPVEQDVLLQWAEDGRVNPGSQIRNTVMHTWTDAVKVPFLADAFRERAGVDAVAATKSNDEDRKMVYSLLETGKFRFTPAGPVRRFMAWLFDVVLLAVVGAVLFLGVHLILGGTPEEMQARAVNVLVPGSVLVFATAYVLYYVFCLGFRAQTVGQWFWGVLIVRTQGEPVFLGRSFVYVVLDFLLLPATILCCILPERRAPQELLTGTRVVRIKVHG